LDVRANDTAPDRNGDSVTTGRRPGWVYALLIIPFIAMLWVPTYAAGAPSIAGVPFFYWYQFLWVIITSGLTWWAYKAER
jgi:hypothetical protein